MFGFGNFRTLAAAAVLMMSAGVAGAAPVSTACPMDNPQISTTRYFTVTIEGPPAAGCVLYNDGNTNGGASGSANALNEAAILAAVAPGTLLDKTDSVGASGVVISLSNLITVPGDPNAIIGGLWSILVPTGKVLTNAFLSFKSGEGNGSPDWALFSLPAGILSGSFAISDPTSGLTAAQLALCTGRPSGRPAYCATSNDYNGYQGLSHAEVYGQLADAPPPPPPPPPPVPVPAAGLMLLGALGGLAALRRRRKSA